MDAPAIGRGPPEVLSNTVPDTQMLDLADILGTLGKSFVWSEDFSVMEDSINAAIDSWMMDVGLPRTTK